MASSQCPASPNKSVAYINGRVYTVNETLPWAEAFIVSSEGRFDAVGLSDDILAIAKARSIHIHDLKGSFIMPGIHDAHIHTIISGSRLLNWLRLGDETSSNGLEKRLRNGICSCSQTHAYEDWIVGGVGFGLDSYDRKLLDVEYPDRPVVLYAGGCHSWYTNTAALERAGYNPESEPDVPGGRYGRRADGTLTGFLTDQAGCRMIAAIPKPPIATIKRAVQRAIAELHRCGVTSCQDASASELLLRSLQELESEGQLQMQFATHILYKNEWLSGEVQSPPERLIMDAERFKSRHVDTRFVKMMMDGAPVPELMSHSDVDEHGVPDKEAILLPDAQELIARFDARGITCKIHCMGFGGTRFALDAFEAVRSRRVHGPRHEIAHCTQVLPDDFARFHKLNITAEMSPADSFDKAGKGFFEGFRYDMDRMVKTGNHVTIGSDWANGMTLPLLPSVASTAQRLGADKVLKIMTLAGARAVGRGEEAGSIEVGKVASFIAIDRDLTKGGFAAAVVTKTWFEGKVVFEAS